MNPLRFSYVRWPALAAALLIAAAPAVQALLSTTGVEDFEAGMLPADWSTTTNGSGGWYNYAGTSSPLSSFPIEAPPQGTRAMITDQGGPGAQFLYTDISVPVGSTGSLSFVVYYHNRSGSFVTPDDLTPTGSNQQYRVDLVKPSAALDSLDPADVLATPFRTNVGDPLTLAPTTITVSLAPFAGTTVRLRFVCVQTNYYFQAGVDDVRTDVSLPDEEIVATTAPLTASEGLTGGGEIYRPMPGVINAANRVAFKAFGALGTGAIDGSNDSLLLTDSSGTLRVIGREGAQVDVGTTSSLQGLLTEHLLTEDGQTVAFDRISGSATPLDQAYVSSGDGETLETLVRTGDSAAGGGLFRAPMPGFVADGNGRVYFVANLSGTGVNARNDSGLWQDDAGVQTLIAREGSDVSSVTTDAAWLGMVLPRVSAAGDGAAFVAFLQNNPSNSLQRTDTARNLVVLDGNENGLSLVARKGDVVPDTSSATLVNVLGVSRSATGAHAVLGLLKFDANTTRSNDLVLVSVSGGTKRLVAQEGVTSIGGSLVRNITDYNAVGNDEVIFLTESALCRWTVAGGISVLARAGSAAPGTAVNFRRMTSLSVSEGGAVALLSILSNGRTGLWRALPGDSLSLVLTTATATTVNGTPRTVLAMGLHRSAGTAGAGGGAGAAINDAGTIFATLSVGSGLHVARRFYP